MRLYIFKSETRKALCAFAGDPQGASSRRATVPGPLPVWSAWTGTPPHKFSRDAIEEAIGGEGFQLWRPLAKKAEA